MASRARADRSVGAFRSDGSPPRGAGNEVFEEELGTDEPDQSSVGPSRGTPGIDAPDIDLEEIRRRYDQEQRGERPPAATGVDDESNTPDGEAEHDRDAAGPGRVNPDEVEQPKQPAIRQGVAPRATQFSGSEFRAISEMLSTYPNDTIVNVFVSQSNGLAPKTPRGVLREIQATIAAQPENYLPHGGTYIVEFQSTRTMKYLGKPWIVKMPGKPPPDDWRVEDMYDASKIAEAVVRALNDPNVGRPGYPPGTIPGNVYGDVRAEIDSLRKELQTEREARHNAEMKALNDKIDSLKNGGGGGGAGQKSDLAAFAELFGKVIEKSGGGAETMLKYMLERESPEAYQKMMVTQGAMFNTMMEAQAKLIEANGGGTTNVLAQLVPLGKDMVKAFHDRTEEGKKQREAWQKAQDEKKRAAAAGEKPKADGEKKPAAKAPAETAPKGEALVSGLREIGETMSTKENAEAAGDALSTLIRSSRYFNWHVGDPDLEKMVSECATSPEQTIAWLAEMTGKFEKKDADAIYLLKMSAQYRRSSGMPPLQLAQRTGEPGPAAQGAAPAAAAVSPPTATPQAAAPAPAPVLAEPAAKAAPPATTEAPKRRPGRPKGSRNKAGKPAARRAAAPKAAAKAPEPPAAGSEPQQPSGTAGVEGEGKGAAPAVLPEDAGGAHVGAGDARPEPAQGEQPGNP